MKKKRSTLEFFHEDMTDALRRDLEQDLPEMERKDLDMLKLIWEESAHYAGESTVQFDSKKAWEKVEPGMEAEAVIRQIGQGSGSDKLGNGARIISFRTFAAAAAAILILVVASRVIFQDRERNYVRKEFSSYAAAVKYAEKELTALATELLRKADASDDFETRLYFMAGQRFDGETNVLVKNLVADEPNRRKWSNMLASFKNIEGDNYYPQVFIPDYEDYTTKGGEPIVVFYLSDEPGPNGYEYMGYHLKDGKLTEYGKINESNLQALKVWVLSINENVDNFGEHTATDQPVLVKNKGRSGQIDKLAIYDAKESWAGGASEVRVRTYIDTWDGVDSQGLAEQFATVNSSQSERGVKVRNFNQQEIESGEVVEVDHLLHSDWDAEEFFNDGIQLSYVLFEADVWPNTVRRATYSLANGDPRHIEFFSAQQPYDVGGIFGTKSPSDWRSAVHPSGIDDSLLIRNFKCRNPSVFFTTEELSIATEDGEEF